jgi:acyl carrier protein
MPEPHQTEQQVIAIWADVLQRREGIGADSNFFELGGDSLAMMMVLFRIGEELAIELSPLALIEAPTPRGLATLLDEARGQ